MALKLFHLISFLVLTFLLLAPIGHAKRHNQIDKKSSPFDFVNKLKGCAKGNNTKEVHELKAYLEKFGYLHYHNKSNINNDDFDGILESAVKTYQENYHVKPTGIIDDETISRMISPRCGVPDIVNGTNYMKPRKNHHVSNSSNIHTVSHFSFFPNRQRWVSKTHLTYQLPSNFPPAAVDPVARAFQQWQAATHFTFSRVENGQKSDLVIEFHRLNHGDIDPFDGRGGTLAHAFAPEDGRFHYDADEPWLNRPNPNAMDLETVAVHEIGHLLGLGHSADETAIMYARIGLGQTKKVGADEIQGIRTLYNR